MVNNSEKEIILTTQIRPKWNGYMLHIPIRVLKYTDVYHRLIEALRTEEVVVDLYIITSIAYYENDKPSLLTSKTTKGVFNIRYLGGFILTSYFDKEEKLKTVYIWFNSKKLQSLGLEPNTTYHFIIKFEV